MSSSSKPGLDTPRTLVIAPNWIGDAVMAQPLLRLLKQQHPQRPIDLLAPAWVAPVLRAMKEVDTVLSTPFRHGALQLRERWRFARELRQRGYAEAYILPNTLKFALIPWLAGIRKRVGYKGESRYGLINVMHHDDPVHPRAMVPFYAALAAPPSASAPPGLPRPALSVDAAQIAAVLSRVGLQQDRPLLAFAPGAEFGNAKRWPTSHFAALANTVLADNSGVQIILLGSGKDEAVCEEVCALSPAVRNLAGKTSLDEAVALIAQAGAVVSNDSGLLHIASALNSPVIAIYGPTDPDHAPPFSDIAHSLSLRLACSPCRQRECPLGHHDCMQKLDSGIVWQKLQAILPHP